jgi:hypothetical protein
MDTWSTVFACVLAAVACSTLARWDLHRRYGKLLAVALRTIPVQVYLVLHATTAAMVTYWLAEYRPDGGATMYLYAEEISAGVAISMLFLHLSLTTVRINDGKSVSIGPALITNALIAAADRSLDRSQAETRAAALSAHFRELTSRLSTDPEINAKALKLQQEDLFTKYLLRETINKGIIRDSDNEYMDALSSQNWLRLSTSLEKLEALGLVDILRSKLGSGAVFETVAIPTREGFLVGDALGLRTSLTLAFD